MNLINPGVKLLRDIILSHIVPFQEDDDGKERIPIITSLF